MMIVIFLIVGLITGIFSGLLGIGGGIITVPAMYYILGFLEIDPTYLIRICISTALATTILTSSGSAFAHARKRAIHPPVLKFTIPGLFLGAILGVILSLFLSADTLKKIFGFMALFLSIYLFFPKLPSLHFAPHPNWTLSFFSMSIGALSTLLGIGGGVFMVPILLGYHIPIKNSVASSSVGTLTTALIGTAAYFIFPKYPPHIPWTLGSVYLPAFFAIGIGSICTTSIGCRLAHTLPELLVKRIFSLVLALTGISMIA